MPIRYIFYRRLHEQVPAVSELTLPGALSSTLRTLGGDVERGLWEYFSDAPDPSSGLN